MGRLGYALVAVLLVAGLASCSDDADGQTPDPTPSSSTTSASPTPTGPTPPPLPDEAEGSDAKAAAKFVEHYIELMNYSASTGDTEAMRAASKNCRACNSYIKLYEKTYAKGGFSGNPGWEPHDAVTEVRGEKATVLVEVRTDSFRYKPSGKATPSRVKATTYSLRCVAVSTNDGWKMSGLDERPELS